jgi:hypothetical protein
MRVLQLVIVRLQDVAAHRIALPEAQRGKKLNSVAFSPQANYTDWATAACWWMLNANFCEYKSVALSALRFSTAVNLGFLDRSCYVFFQVAPHLYSRGWVDPVPDRALLRKYDIAGNRTRNLWGCSQEPWPLDHRGGEQTRQVCTDLYVVVKMYRYILRTW